MRNICEDCHHMFDTDDENQKKCNACRMAYEHSRELCRNYLAHHHGASISEISKETHIPVRLIKLLIKEGSISYK